MDPDLKTTLREFREYVTLSYELPSEIAARIGLTQPRIWDWLAGKSQPKAKSLMKLRRFLDAEAKKPLQGDGIRPVEPVPYKITKPIQQVRYARLCPFCRKARGQIRKLGAASFQGACPKCGATWAEAGEPSRSAQGVEWEGIKREQKRAIFRRNKSKSRRSRPD
ncbi:MAG TPA: helix-turn-helix transcriptional regulator [Chthoniobacterales bacterium]|jgi:transcriptional regulator with XRE-family HTH domain|nr:helix-turn-helix transcriptional regulator [Chthoniobacterales bacterium]